VSAFFPRVLMSCEGRGPAIGRSPLCGALQKCLQKFIFSEVHSESEQARGPAVKLLDEQRVREALSFYA
jgi:hypothetical protein